MAAVEITPEMVLAVSKIGRERAERIAAYASLRFGGLLVTDASRDCGLTDATARSYEKWLPLLRDRFDLPAPPKSGVRLPYRDYRETGRSGGHQTHHVQRGIVSPTCPLCQGSPR